MTKTKIKAILTKFIQSKDNTIYTAYKRPSLDKVNAYRDCINLEFLWDGSHGTVMNTNSNSFSYAFLTNKFGKLSFVYITKKYIYIYSPLEDLLTIKVR